MDFYVVESHKLVIGWNPKCACTAVCDWLVKAIIKPKDPINEDNRAFLRNNGFLRAPEDAHFFILEKGFKSMFFVRNPITRLASGFIDKFICRRGQALIYPDNYEQLVINTINDFYSINNYAGDYKGMTFADLIDYIAGCIETERILDHHWMPQISNINLQLKNQILAGNCFVVKQELFSHDIKNINFALGLSYLPPKINGSDLPKTWKDVPKKSDYSRVSNQSIIENKVRITKENILNNVTKSAISRIYQDDFKLFSYVPVKENI